MESLTLTFNSTLTHLLSSLSETRSQSPGKYTNQLLWPPLAFLPGQFHCPQFTANGQCCYFSRGRSPGCSAGPPGTPSAFDESRWAASVVSSALSTTAEICWVESAGYSLQRIPTILDETISKQCHILVIYKWLCWKSFF